MKTAFLTDEAADSNIFDDDVVIEVAPAVTWRTVALVVDPLERPTEARIATLRRNGALSEGCRLPNRTPLRVEGSSHYYSWLSLIAAILYRRGRREEAREWAKVATQQERTDLFASWLNRESLTVPPDWAGQHRTESWASVLGGDLLSRLQQVQDSLSLQSVSARWIAIREGHAIITTASGEEIATNVDSPQLSESNLGDPLLIIRERTDAGTEIRYAVPAVAFPSSGEHSSEYLPESTAEASELLDPSVKSLPDDDKTRQFISDVISKAKSRQTG